MATKRSSPTDVESSPKQARTEGQTHLRGFEPTSASRSTPVISTFPSIGFPVSINQPVPIHFTAASVPSTIKMSHVSLTSDTVELTCSSPSQFLHPPLVVSSASMSSSTPLLATSGTSTPSRQPICSVEGRLKVQGSTKSVKSKLVKNLKAKIVMVKSRHTVLLKDQFFLESGGNLMDFFIWKKRPNVLLDQFLKLHDLDLVSTSHEIQAIPKELSEVDSAYNVTSSIPRSVGRLTTTTTPSTPKQSSLLSSTTIQIPLSTVSPTLHVTPPKGGTPLSPAKSITFPLSSPRPATRSHASFSSVYENSHEDIVMRARHEAEVMKSISELRKDGLWCASRLPKVKEPVRIKTHWDFLLEEMQWLSTDFANEKRWKVNAARKV